MITEVKARDIASEWYSGQWSALYLIMCNEGDKYSRLTGKQWSEAYFEAMAIGRYDVDARRSDGSKLASWIVCKARKYGYVANAALLTDNGSCKAIR